MFLSNGTGVGTVELGAVGTATANAFNILSDRPIVNVNGVYYFSGNSQSTIDGDLWRTDGTEAGTTLVKDFDEFYGVRDLTNVNGTLFFSAGDPVNGRELWKSDGTSVGTVIVKDISAGASSADPDEFLAVGSTLYFTASSPASGRELWKSNGTAAVRCKSATLIQAPTHRFPAD